VYDPATGDPTNGRDRTPFPGNIIPTSRIDPVATKILSYIPPPNQPFIEATPSNNYFALLPALKTNDAFDVKVDYTISDKYRVSGRFSFSHPVTFQAPRLETRAGRRRVRSWARASRKPTAPD